MNYYCIQFQLCLTGEDIVAKGIYLYQYPSIYNNGLIGTSGITIYVYSIKA